MLYKTEIDGMRTIQAETLLQPNQYVTIQDKMYDADNSLFKAKSISGDQVQLQLVKTVETIMVQAEDIHTYKSSQLYHYENGIYTTENRLSKKQVILLSGNFYEVSEIEKQKNEPSGLTLLPLSPMKTTNLYAVYKNKKSAKNTEKEVILQTSSYYEAIWLVAKKRAENDDYFYFIGS